ncbi:MAG: hypothetical protein RIS35_1229 [Pseudomonadota bacterium]
MTAEVPAIRLPRSVTFRTAVAVLDAMQPAIVSGAREFDLAECEEFDSSLVAVLLELFRRATQAGGAGCRVTNPPANLRKLASLYGVDGILFDQRD